MITKTNSTNIIPDIEKHGRDLAKNSPQWATALRQEAASRFTKLGLPTVKDEEWKYTNLAPITTRTFHLPAPETAPILKEELFAYCDKSEINIVLVNGHFVPEFSNLKEIPEGITILSLDEAFKKTTNLAELLKKQKSLNDDAFVALNDALVRDGVYIEVGKKALIKDLIHIVHVTDTKDANAALFPRNLIVVNRQAEATVLESHLGLSGQSYLANPVSDIFLDEDAKLIYCKAQNEGAAAFHIGTTRIWQERNSQLTSFSMMVGAHLTRNNLNIRLNGEGAGSILHGLYITNSDQHVDNHTCVDHQTPNCTSNQLYKGILTEKSRAVFNGKIFVRQIAQKTNSYQLNKNLILGEDCRVDTKPQLEIYADDVKCTHGATIGQLNEDEIFYLQTRCIDRNKAIKMLSRGFVDDILETIPNQSINTKLHKLLAPTFLGEK